MNFLPIVDREMRSIARRPMTYYVRSLMAAAVGFISLGMLYAGFGGVLSPAMAGRNLFVILSFLGYVYVLLEGAFRTADCLSHEKREGTLGLLFLTNLKGYDVVAGKFASQAWSSFYCLLAAFPVPGFAFFLGGLAVSDFLRMTLVLTNTLFFSVALGMLISALSRSEYKAVGTALGTAFFLGCLLPVEGVLLKSAATNTIHPIFLVMGPSGSFLEILYPGISSAPGVVFGWSLLVTHLAGWICLVSASFILPYSWQEKISVGPRLRAPTPGRWSRWFSNETNVPPDPSGEDPWHEVNPVYWIGVRMGRRGITIRHFFLAIGIVWLAALILYPSYWIKPSGWTARSGVPGAWFNPPIFIGIALFMHYLLRFMVAFQACHALAEDRRNGVLELLLTTPLDADEIMRGRMLALKRKFLFPTGVVLGMDAILLATGLPWLEFGSQILFAGMFLGGMGLLMADLYTLAWVGLWLGLKMPRANRAIRQTLVAVLFLPWLLLLASLALLGIFSQGSVAGSDLGVVGVLGAIALFFANNVGFLGWSMTSLRDDFRTMAIQSYMPSPKRRYWWNFVRRN